MRRTCSRPPSSSISAGSSSWPETARPFVCQSQSVNLFLAADVHKRDLHQIHLAAWKKGVKSLYYCRSKSIQRAESAANDGVEAGVRPVPVLGRINGREQPKANGGDYEECLACQ